MAPRKPVPRLSSQSLEQVVRLVQNTLYQETTHYYVHDEKTNQVDSVTQYIRDEVKEAVQSYICDNLPPDLQTILISTLLGLNNAASPHLVLDLLVTKKLCKLKFELTQENRKQILGEKDTISRVSEDDISKCLKTLTCVLEEFGSENMALEQLYMIDKTQDPDFQGDPINNMNNTNLDSGGREGDWAGIMSRLSRLSQLLSSAPRLTRVVLPFASDQILAHVANIRHLKLFQNVYRSTITETGVLALAEGTCRHSLTHVVLSLNTHANVPNFCISALLKNAGKLKVLELGGSKHTKSLYFQGGDAKRRTEVYKMICQQGDQAPEYTNNLARLFVFRENGITPLKFTPMLRHCPNLTGLTLFGWEYVRVDRASWVQLSTRLVHLEVIGMGFAASDVQDRKSSLKFDQELLLEAKKLKHLKVAGWGDTEVDLYKLLTGLPSLHSVYFEDLKINLHLPKMKKGQKVRHGLTCLSMSHCSTSDVNLIQMLCCYLPQLVELTVSSLYVEDPNRGLPFHFHLPQHELNQIIRHPVADLQVISKLEDLERLHLNVNYTTTHSDNDFALPQLLIKGFPELRKLHLDNFINRRGGILSYTFDRVRLNNRLQWFLNQYNRDIVVDLN